MNGDDVADRFAAVRKQLRRQYLTPLPPYPWVIGFSGGKDSTLLAHLVFEMLMTVCPSDRKRPIYIACNDTLVESPQVAAHVRASLAMIEHGADALGLPVTVHRTRPEHDQTFWVNLLGRGYPAPNRVFRWCTDRMKIRPTGRLLSELVDAHGGAVLLLGVRRSESTTRARSIDAHTVAGSVYNPHSSNRGVLVFSPISDLTDDDVWTFLMQCRPAWGGNHHALVQLYRDALGGECPFVVSTDDAPSCGSGSPRFGCWTCTVVQKDRSLAGLAQTLDDDRLEALGAFRDRLREVSNDPAYRSPIRRNGAAGLGPLTFEARAMLLDELLALQAETGLDLVPPLEVEEIRRTWESDHVRDVVRESDRFLALFAGAA